MNTALTNFRFLFHEEDLCTEYAKPNSKIFISFHFQKILKAVISIISYHTLPYLLQLTYLTYYMNSKIKQQKKTKPIIHTSQNPPSLTSQILIYRPSLLFPLSPLSSVKQKINSAPDMSNYLPLKSVILLVFFLAGVEGGRVEGWGEVFLGGG